jgi:hypothetical protein
MRIFQSEVPTIWKNELQLIRRGGGQGHEREIQFGRLYEILKFQILSKCLCGELIITFYQRKQIYFEEVSFLIPSALFLEETKKLLNIYFGAVHL